MNEDIPDFRVERLKSALSSLIGRFFFTVFTTLVLTFFIRKSLQNDPNALKWILTTIWVDIFAYFLGFLNGYKSAILALYSVIVGVGNNIFSNKRATRDEE